MFTPSPRIPAPLHTLDWMLSCCAMLAQMNARCLLPPPTALW